MRKKYLLLCVLLDIMAVGLIPLNLLLLDMPEYITVAFSLAVIAGTALFIGKSNARKALKAFVCILAVFTVAVSILGSYCLPYWNSVVMRGNADYDAKPYDHVLSSDEAEEDLEYAMKYLRKLHPALYKSVPESINQQYEQVKNELRKHDGIRVNELCRMIESVFSILKDGHTYIRGNDEDRRIMKFYRQWKNEGYEITAVNGRTIDQLLQEKSAYYSFESAAWEYEWLSDDIVTVAGLDYLGFDTEKGVEYTLTSENGLTRTENCFPEDFLVWEEYARFNDIAVADGEEESFVSYKIDRENSLAILRLDACIYNDEYVNCVRSMFEEVKALDIRNVAVDLRDNGGGSDLVVSEFFKYLDIDSYKIMSMSWRLGFFYLHLGDGIAKNSKYQDLLFDGELYILTSAGTFSSAMEFAEYVKDNELGIIIGEAPGNNPNGYGEVAGFQLPHSELFMQISTKRFYRADRACTDESVVPDIPCNRDAAMEQLYTNIKESR